jgi:pimeloyl-ACP methyl ester carboxylesterase
MRLFNQDGSSLYYQSHGNGEPVLLIHGLGCSGVDWALQIPALETRFRVIVPDLPGCGSSSPPTTAYSIAGFALALWALLDQLQVPRISIVGFSMGGAVALEMALQRPSLVPRLALINSLATYRDQWGKWIQARFCTALIRLFGMRRAAGWFAAGLFPKPWQKTYRTRAAAVVGAVPARSYLSMLRALEQWEATDRLERVRSRTLVIAAEHDHTPLAEKRDLAGRLRASLAVISGSRHGTPFDATEATNSSLLALLTDQPLSAYDRLACDTPTCARAEFPSRRVLQLITDSADSLGRTSEADHYLPSCRQSVSLNSTP